MHLNEPLLEQQNTNYKGLKKNCTHAHLGQIMNNKIQKGQNPTAASEGPGAKAGHCTDPCTWHHQGGGGPLEPRFRPTHRSTPTVTHFRNQPPPDPRPLLRERARAPGTFFRSLILKVSKKPRLNSSSVLYQFLLIKESKSPGE